MEFEIYCLANNKIGYGHLNRCLSLARTFKKKRWNIKFNILGDSSSTRIIRKNKFGGSSYYTFNNLLKNTLSKTNGYFKTKIILLDITHESILSKKNKLIQLIHFIKKNSFKLIIIDSFGSSSLNHMLNKINIEIDILIIPYFSSLKPPENAKLKLIGPKYFIFSKYYMKLKKRKINRLAKNILVTCGGSDPKKITTLILESLSKINKSLNIKVVIGPLFKDSFTKKLNLIRFKNKQIVTFIHNPSHLRDHMLWSDLTISTSGLTKYELAITGTPSIILSIDNYHNDMNRFFKKIGSTFDLGYLTNKAIMHQKIDYILNNYVCRKSMSISGQLALDALGTERITKVINKLKFK